MGVYATILYVQYPYDFVQSLECDGARLTGTSDALDPDANHLRIACAYQRSHAIPEAGNESTVLRERAQTGERFNDGK